MAVIHNIAAHLENLSASVSSKLLQLFSSMSSPGFLLANESNHDLLRSLLESMNAIIEHQYSSKSLDLLVGRFSRNTFESLLMTTVFVMLIGGIGNPNFLYAVIRNKKRFEGRTTSLNRFSGLTFLALRSFTLESGQEEIERRNRRRKEHGADPLDLLEHRRGSVDSLRSPSSHQRAPALSNVPEDGTFAIGEDEDEDTDDDHRPTPAESTPTEQSRASSISSSVDDAVPSQLRGMSEKARGKMPGKQFS